MSEDDFISLGLSSKAQSTINDPDRMTCVFPALAEIDWPWHCSVCYKAAPQSFLLLNVVGATGPGFQVLLNPLLALVAVSLAMAGPAPEIYPVPICPECRSYSSSDIVCTEIPSETTLGEVSAGNGVVAIAFSNRDYAMDFLHANEKLAFPNGEGLSDFKVADALKAARANRATKARDAGLRIDETKLLSKTITAVALMQLVERGKLELDTPIQKYCAAYPVKQWPLTARQLLAHMGGVRDYNNQKFLEEYFSTRHYSSVTESLEIFKSDPLVQEPGTKYSYST